jgi:hypothetical protein
MHTPRITIGFITLSITCGLVFGGFTSVAAAHRIIVTTLTDTADPPFDTDGACGTGTVGDLPGADHLISLREAIIAVNNTAGANTITFDPSLSNGLIVVNFDDLDTDTAPDPLPALCSGHTRIKGDLNSDDVPDITLEGAAFPAASAAAGLLVLSSHNTLNGLRIQHFPVGIRVRAGDLINPGTVEHTRVTNNIVADSKLDGLFVATGNVPGSRLAHTTIAQNQVRNNARHGILVVASLSAAGADSHISHLLISDNEVIENGVFGIFLFSQGDRNVLSNGTIAHNLVAQNAFFGIDVNGGFNGADGNHFDLRIQNNTVRDNRHVGIRLIGAQDNSSHNSMVARITRNTLERNQFYGIAAVAGEGAVNFPTGISNNNVLDVRIERNTVREQSGVGIGVSAGIGSPDGRAGAVADNNYAFAIVKYNTSQAVQSGAWR